MLQVSGTSRSSRTWLSSPVMSAPFFRKRTVRNQLARTGVTNGCVCFQIPREAGGVRIVLGQAPPTWPSAILSNLVQVKPALRSASSDPPPTKNAYGYASKRRSANRGNHSNQQSSSSTLYPN